MAPFSESASSSNVSLPLVSLYLSNLRLRGPFSVKVFSGRWSSWDSSSSPWALSDTGEVSSSIASFMSARGRGWNYLPGCFSELLQFSPRFSYLKFYFFFFFFFFLNHGQQEFIWSEKSSNKCFSKPTLLAWSSSLSLWTNACLEFSDPIFHSQPLSASD